MSPLTLPGTIPGLLRRGSPVILATRTYGGSVFLDAARGVVCSDGGRVATETLGGSPVLVSTGAGDLALDLSDPTGRAHAAWWLEAQPVWRAVYRRSEGAWWFGERFGIPNLSSGSFCAVARQRRAPWDFRWAIVVPSLANLVDDGRRLPDGSRWVDAEALRLVCLHVAGLTP